MQHITLKKHILPYTVNEELKLLRTNIQFCGIDKRVILLTSAMSNEGKSTMTLYICRAFAELGKKVLLIDADLRKSVMKKRIIGGGITAGLSQYLAGMCGIEDIIAETDEPNLHSILAGQVSPNPSELLSGQKLQDLLNYAREKYDYVFVDCPPLGLVVDAAVVAPLCDGSILVISAGEIHRQMAKEVVVKLQNTKCHILGVVLNKVDRSKGSKYYAKYYGRYYGKSYGEYYEYKQAD